MVVIEDAELQILERLSEKVVEAERAFDKLDFLSEKSLRRLAEQGWLKKKRMDLMLRM